jgi:hypothetical protein
MLAMEARPPRSDIELPCSWIPAFAGMTLSGYRMTLSS